jgi:hypothetical protein
VLALGYKYFAPLGLLVCGGADSWDFQLKLSFAVFATFSDFARTPPPFQRFNFLTFQRTHY